MASRLILKSFKTINTASSVLARFGATASVQQVGKRLPSMLVNSRPFTVSSIALQQESSNILKDLSSFLTQEIQQENANRKHKALPKVSGFAMKTDGPNVTFSKTHNNENISVKFNINGSLDNQDEHVDENLDIEKAKADAEVPQMKSRPPFTIDIAKGGQVLSFGCSFLPIEEGDQKDAVEDFQIDEFAIHTGEWNENVYTADCSVLDGNLYDILLNLLDERGMGEKFANELAEFSTAFEHSQYVGLLEKLQQFSK